MLAGLAPATPLRTLLIFGIVLALATALAVPLLLPRGGNPSPVGVLVREAGGALTPGTRMAMADFREPNAVWETRRVVQVPVEEISTDAAAAYLAQPGPRGVIISREAWEQLHATDPAWQIYEARGFNAARLRKLDLMLIVKPAT
jgi:hypothetical protein